ncbi:MAG: efflux RND transporter permease subunit [Geminicoccaceae bacterium]
MMRWMIGSSVKYRLLVIVVSAAILLVGISQLRNAPIEGLPDFGPVRVEVQTEALGLSPEEVENLITNPMEQEFFNGMPWLHKIRSNSLPGLSSVEMIFEPGTDPIRARQVVQERLTMTPALPAVSKPPFVIQPTATTNRLMIIGLSSTELSLIDISVLARWKIRQRLLAVPGISNVSIWGFRDRQLQVLIDPEKLKQQGVNVDNVIRTAGNAMWSSPLTYVEASTPGTGGFIDTAHQRIAVNHRQPIQTADALSRVTIEGQTNGSVTLGEVADVTEMHQLLIGDALVNDGPGVMLVVERFPNTSVQNVTRAVETALDAMRPGLAGIDIDTTVFRSASFLETARDNLVASLAIGFVLLILVLAAFLMNWRVALITVAATSVSFAAAWLVLSAYGAMLNMMIVAGLVMAIAIVVDDSIVDIDHIRRRLQHRKTGTRGASVIDTVVAASEEIRLPLLTALAIVIASVVPVFVLGEVSGAFLQPMMIAYATAVVVSMIVALTLTPALASVLLDGEPESHAEPPVARWLSGTYSAILRGAVKQPALMLGLSAVIVVIGALALSGIVRPNLVPELQDREIVARLKAAPGTSLPAMQRMAQAASEEIRTIPGVGGVGAHIGRASTSDLVNSVDAADLWINMKPDADYDATLAAIRSTMHGYPHLRGEVSAYPNLRVREVTRGSDDDLVVRVYGRDYEVLLAKADTVAKSVIEVPGVTNPRVIEPVVEPTVEVEVIVPKASAAGVKPGDVRRAAATMLSSITAGNLFEEQKIFDVVVWGEPTLRDSLTSVNDVLVDAPNGGQVRLGDVADVRIRPNPSVIKHDAVSRYVDVVADVTGRGLDAVTLEVDTRLEQISFPSEHHVEVMGEAAERQQTMRTLIGYVIGALVLGFFLLQACFSSWRNAFLALFLLLVPLAGSLLTASLFSAISILSLVGGVVVLAIAVRGGILLITHYGRLEAEGMTPGSDLVLRGAEERFGAVLLGSAAVAAVLLPLVVSGMAAGFEILTPLTAIVLGGLIANLLLNLFILPSLYLWISPTAATDQPSEAAGEGDTTAKSTA